MLSTQILDHLHQHSQQYPHRHLHLPLSLPHKNHLPKSNQRLQRPSPTRKPKHTALLCHPRARKGHLPILNLNQQEALMTRYRNKPAPHRRIQKHRQQARQLPHRIPLDFMAIIRTTINPDTWQLLHSRTHRDPPQDPDLIRGCSL
jgi:hypothetical protein